MKHSLKWFLARRGCRIFRDKNTCPCESCVKWFNEGIIVGDEDEAKYLEMVQYELDFNYSDKKPVDKKK